MKNREKGSSSLADMTILVLLCIVIFIFIIPARKGGPPERNLFNVLGTYIGSPAPGSVEINTDTANPAWTKNMEKSSSLAGSISLGQGNASYTYEPGAEYVTIDNRDSSTNITGWSLKNAKNLRAYTLGNSVQHFEADVSVIPQGTLYISPSGNNTLRNIVLENGDRAIVTTGYPPGGSKFKLTSFKENICSGYLTENGGVTFNPPLSQSCPRPNKEAGIENLDNQCRSFIDSMSSCHTPEYDSRVDGEILRGSVDGKVLSSSCVSFIKTHYSYGACISNHLNDSDFYIPMWRIYLGRSWELWDKEHEVISLLDSSGKLVDYRSY